MSCVKCLAKHLCYVYGEPREDYSCELFKDEEEESRTKEKYKELAERANQVALSYWKQCCEEIEERRRKMMEEKLSSDDLFGGAFNLEELGIEEVSVDEPKKEEKEEKKVGEAKEEVAQSKKQSEDGSQVKKAHQEQAEDLEREAERLEESALGKEDTIPIKEGQIKLSSEREVGIFFGLLEDGFYFLSQIAEKMSRAGCNKASIIRTVGELFISITDIITYEFTEDE